MPWCGVPACWIKYESYDADSTHACCIYWLKTQKVSVKKKRKFTEDAITVCITPTHPSKPLHHNLKPPRLRHQSLLKTSQMKMIHLNSNMSYMTTKESQKSKCRKNSSPQCPLRYHLWLAGPHCGLLHRQRASPLASRSSQLRSGRCRQERAL